MIIENSEVLKSWLTSSLGSICDADPGALANYVLALVKKDKEENELYEFCLDQLDVFLLKDTKFFVDLLFDALRSKSYLAHKPDSTHIINAKNCNTVSSTVQQDPFKDRIDSEKEKNSQPNFEKSSLKTSTKVGSPPLAPVSKEINAEKHGEATLLDEKYKKLSPKLTKARKHDQERSHDKQTENSVDKLTKSSHLSTPVNSHFPHSHSPSSPPSVSREKIDEQAKYDIWKEKERGKKQREELQKHPVDYANSDYKPKEMPPVYKNTSYLLNNNTSGKNSKRCQDYDEKGYCMRGDLCQFDHGSDPVVVEDVSILNFGVSIANVSSSDSIVNTLPDPHVQNVSKSPLPPPPPAFSPPPLPPPPPPLPPLPPSDPFCASSCSFLTSAYIPEPYNPEAPGMNISPQDNPPFWVPSNAILHLPPPPPMHNSSPQSLSGMPNMQLHHHNIKPHRSRELIGVPTVEVTSSTNIIENLQSDEITAGKKRKGFDFSRLGPKPKKLNLETRCTLEVRKVPRKLNSISSLNKHFLKFGKVTNIQVCFENDPEAALIQFQNHAEATAAYKSTEAVLNNRFIKVFWHSSYKEKPFDASTVVREPPKPTEPSIQATEKKSDVPTSNFFTEKNSIEKTILDRSVTYSTRGNLCRTVFNPSVLKKTDTVSAVPSLRTQKEDVKGLHKRLELHKKKQEFLESQIKNQKIILARLSKAKNEKEKVFLKKTIEDLANKITLLEVDVRKSSKELMSCFKSYNAQASTKTEAEKELLDAEMDLYNKQHRGDDTAELNAKVNELRQKAKSLGLLPASTPFLEVGLKQKPRQTQFPKPTSASLKVDNRPRTLIASGFQNKEALKKHFQQFGDLEKIDENKAGITVSFKSRKAAEVALQNGKQFNDAHLILSWFQEDQHIASESNEQENVDNEKNESLHLLDEDEDDEEDSEARSWRR